MTNGWQNVTYSSFVLLLFSSFEYFCISCPQRRLHAYPVLWLNCL